MESITQRASIRVACFILALWGVYLSTAALLLTAITPSSLRPRSRLVYSLKRQLRKRRLRDWRCRHHKKRSGDASSDHTLVEEAMSKGHDELLTLASIPRHVRAGSIQSGSSLHTTSTDDTFFTSTNTSSEHLSLRHVFTMKRACCRKNLRDRSPRRSGPLPRSPYSRFKSLFKHDNPKSYAEDNIKPRSVLSFQMFDRYPEPTRVVMARSHSFPFSDPIKVRSKRRWKLLSRAIDSRDES
ncbi:uncharacterized protein EV420DRAFT_1637597 [Desarmillaria tabescens]|uniref:Uncharacterized protein n=1 Tax=Armillaria tabescens TaxID=1929756 RepID=A0AA39TSY4_ARMTA|nr:uncharacterized protein EV420DRAFT_1637597 [Desarmillaria tabescens]KAK0465463.1 hypothetical protein EV420DRAFT_1637597 [Desarmillaria tabescens]